MVAGRRNVERVEGARIAPRAPRTLISTRLAGDVGSMLGPQHCTRLPWLGRVCGVTSRVTIALPGCEAVRVRAIAAPMPRGTDLVVGADVVSRIRCRESGR
ncbi:MAG TPA: hypothetical protein VHO06_26645 [Polyangia bacterium]|nr:hypothetical protein [Polyangia bacterium]